MAQFTDVEKQLLEQVTDDRLRASLALIRQAAEDIWAEDAPRIVQDYTDHGISHSERLASFTTKLLEANDGRNLSAQEMYLLLAGIYLHDIGMQCDVVKFPEIKERAEELGAQFDTEFTARTASEYTIDEQKAIRKNHQYLTAAWIDHANRTGETVLESAAKSIPDDLVDDLMEVCEHHAKVPITDCPRKFRFDPNERKQLVAALLRFADELDVDGHRVSIETVKNFRLAPRNAVYWWLHNCTKVVFSARNMVLLTIRLHPKDSERFGPFVHAAFITKFRSKNRPVLSALARDGVPVVISDSSKVMKHDRAEPLPPEIKQALQAMQQRRDPLTELADEISTWLEAIRYEVSEPQHRNDRTVEMLATLDLGSVKQRVLVRCIGGEVVPSDVDALDEVLDRETPQGWLITDRRVSDRARKRAAGDDAFQVFSLAEFLQEMIWGPYFEALASLVEKQRIPELYVDLGCYKQEMGKEGHEIGRDQYDSLDDYIDGWLTERGKMHISLLGEFGSGKTWFCRHYAYRQLHRYLEDPVNERLPLLITMRTFIKSMTARQLINDALLEQYKLPFVGSAYEVFQETNRRGKLLLVLDGFDEMARQVDYQTVVDNFWELAELVGENSKVILTSRTEYFRWAKESEKVLGGEEFGRHTILLASPKFEVLHLEPFTDDHIREVITRRLGAEHGLDVAERILDTPDLAEMARKPVLVELLLVALDEVSADVLENPAQVYLYATNKLLLRNIDTKRTFTTTTDKLYFLCELAWEMIRSGELCIHYSDIPERIEAYFGDRIRDQHELDTWDYDLRNQTLLHRDAAGYYEFAHKSLAEYFVAFKFAAELGCLAPEYAQAYCEVDGKSCKLPFARKNVSELTETFGALPLSDERMQAVRDFLRGMVDDADRLWALIAQTRDKTLEDVNYVGSNAATVLNQMDEGFAERDLSGTVLVAADLTDADLTRSNLHGAILRQAILRGAMLKEAVLEDTDLANVSCTARDLKNVQPEYLIALLEETTVCSRAAAALGMAGSEKAIPALLDLLERKEEHIRGTAAFSLGMIQSPQAIPHLIPLLTDSHQHVRGEAAFALGMLRAVAAAPDLVQLLDDEHAHVRGRACEALGRIGATEAIPELTRLLNDEHEAVRGRACKALGWIGATEAIPELTRLLNDEHEYVRGPACKALGWIGAAEAIPELIRLLNDEHEYVRGRACEALGELEAVEATPKLVLLLKDEHETVRGGAAMALGKLQATEAIVQLTSLLDDEYENVRIRAGTALREIGTLLHGYDQKESEL